MWAAHAVYTLTCSRVATPLLYLFILELSPAFSASFSAALYMSRRPDTNSTDPPIVLSAGGLVDWGLGGAGGLVDWGVGGAGELVDWGVGSTGGSGEVSSKACAGKQDTPLEIGQNWLSFLFLQH